MVHNIYNIYALYLRYLLGAGAMWPPSILGAQLQILILPSGKSLVTHFHILAQIGSHHAHIDSIF